MTAEAEEAVQALTKAVEELHMEEEAEASESGIINRQGIFIYEFYRKT